MAFRNPIWWLLCGLILAVAGVTVTERGADQPTSDSPATDLLTSTADADEPTSPAEDRVSQAERLLAQPPLVIGPTARVVETCSGLPLLARVDTGAAVTSLHCTEEDFVIDEASDDPFENRGKAVRLRVENNAGESEWIETEVLDYVEVRSANGAEHRYQVRLPLQCGSVQKETIVNLNDRSQMSFRLLLGRDFLAGNFVVDVARPEAPSF